MKVTVGGGQGSPRGAGMAKRRTIPTAILRQVAVIERACYPRRVLAATERATTTMCKSSARFVVAHHNGKAVGYAIVEVEGSYGYVANLAVLPSRRRTPSVCKQLLSFLREIIVNCHVVEAYCRETSRGLAIRELERLGYKVSSALNDYLFPGEVVTSIRATKL